jgi:hypothetical protein
VLLISRAATEKNGEAVGRNRLRDKIEKDEEYVRSKTPLSTPVLQPLGIIQREHFRMCWRQ